MARILVVEDDPSTRSLFTMALRSAGHQVLTARDGLEGVAIARRELPHLVFMDLMMPRMDGETAARTLRRDPRTVGMSIVAVSAKQVTPEARHFFDGCLRKPCSLGAILDMVRRCAGLVYA